MSTIPELPGRPIPDAMDAVAQAAREAQETAAHVTMVVLKIRDGWLFRFLSAPSLREAIAGL